MSYLLWLLSEHSILLRKTQKNLILYYTLWIFRRQNNSTIITFHASSQSRFHPYSPSMEMQFRIVTVHRAIKSFVYAPRMSSLRIITVWHVLVLVKMEMEKWLCDTMVKVYGENMGVMFLLNELMYCWGCDACRVVYSYLLE